MTGQLFVVLFSPDEEHNFSPLYTSSPASVDKSFIRVR